MEEVMIDLVKAGLKAAKKYKQQQKKEEDEEETMGSVEDIDGIVLSGGCALNVLANSRIASEFPHLPLHIPSAPNDCGLSLGSSWLIAPPKPLPLNNGDSGGDDNCNDDNGASLSSSTCSSSSSSSDHHGQQLQYLGLPLFDETNLTFYANKYDAEYVNFSSSSSSSFKKLALLLKDENIIGIVRGHSEHGPRALGHRSLFAYPKSGMKERLNTLKHREWWRPVAPILIEEESDLMFIRDVPSRPLKSPFMSFAPKTNPEFEKILPSLSHFDGTARPQTVSSIQNDIGYEPWLHQLLSAVKKEIGYGVLINTSFNSKGKPILNTISEALELLNECPDLDYVLINDWLFEKHQMKRLLKFYKS
jgi:carbamoyltransferase